MVFIYDPVNEKKINIYQKLSSRAMFLQMKSTSHTSCMYVDNNKINRIQWHSGRPNWFSIIRSTSQAAIKPSKKSGEIIHKISIYTLDECLKNEILHFSHQILHKNLRITACGMFSIDYSLVFNVIASVTTFIVILIQFALAIKYSPSGTFTTAIIDSTDRYD